jgi:hypothetical protein
MSGTERYGSWRAASSLWGEPRSPTGLSRIATPDPYWADQDGRRLPKKPCPKCGANVGPMPLRVENLRHLGWQPYTVQSY